MAVADLSIRPLNAPFGAEVVGVDLRDELSEDLRARIRDAWHKHSMLLFRGQDLNEAQHLAVASIFGEISKQGRYERAEDLAHGQKQTETKTGFNYVSTFAKGELNQGGGGPMGFHSDYTFYDRPLSGLMLYAIEVPPPGEGGATLFSSTKLAYESLPPALRAKVDKLKIRHGQPDSRLKMENPPLLEDGPFSEHDLAMSHPVTGEKMLFMSRRHVDAVVGMPREESDALIAELHAYVKLPENQYAHAWLPGDLVVWDNFALQHARTDFDSAKYRRHLRRLQIK